ncbi:unnamed protein product [Rhizophagus irregularis]|uniref:Uncharacterized protein n=1 Tax=Rhizophagus irregularis TaxID=588596 RepID=A0A915YYF8_9GLOM|nr:unnamed protein product [Rhizophagus irregularis]
MDRYNINNHIDTLKIKKLMSVKERYQFALELKLEILEPDWKMIVNYQRSLLTEDNDYNIYFNGLYKTLENNQAPSMKFFDMKISNYLPAIENFHYNVDKCAVRFKRSIMQIRISEEFSLTECKQQEVSIKNNQTALDTKYGWSENLMLQYLYSIFDAITSKYMCINNVSTNGEIL